MSSEARAQSGPDGCWFRGNASNAALRASPRDSTSLVLEGGTAVKVCYGRPQRRGRAVMGQLVPYDVPWRMGADEATAIHVPFPARIAGVNVAPGWYSLYAIPQAKQWRIVVNGIAERWGIPIGDDVSAKDIGSGVVPTEHLDKQVEMLTMTLTPKSKSSATLDVAWENTRVRIPVDRR
jgi:hypothetical protein